MVFLFLHSHASKKSLPPSRVEKMAANSRSLPQTEETRPASSSNHTSLSLKDSPSSKEVCSTLEWCAMDAMGPFTELASSA